MHQYGQQTNSPRAKGSELESIWHSQLFPNLKQCIRYALGYKRPNLPKSKEGMADTLSLN